MDCRSIHVADSSLHDLQLLSITYNTHYLDGADPHDAARR